mgnify:CR=1 FL=1
MPNPDRSYHNFDLRIDKDSASGEYLISVAYSPAGETSMPALLRLPFSNTFAKILRHPIQRLSTTTIDRF